MEESRMVTLHQPYASLIAWGLKQVETRPKTISWRYFFGHLYIHAAQRIPSREELETIKSAMPKHPRVDEFWDFYKSADDLPYSAIVCRTEMDGHLLMTVELIKKQTPLEIAVGGWAVGRLAIPLTEIARPATPIPAVGGQGIRKIKHDVQRIIDAAFFYPVTGIDAAFFESVKGVK